MSLEDDLVVAKAKTNMVRYDCLVRFKTDGSLQPHHFAFQCVPRDRTRSGKGFSASSNLI